MSDQVSCIDISHWQGFPDFDKVMAVGVVACIFKASEGTDYVDPNRIPNTINAINAGIAVATYHWLSPGSDPTEQMQFYLSTINPVVGERVVIDYEEEGCALDDLKEAVAVLVADPRDLRVTVYSGHLLKDQLGDSHDAFLADNTDLWLAQYTTGEPSWPAATYPNWTLWQYAEDGQIDGIDDANVDLNRFNGSNAKLVAWISPTPLRPPRLSLGLDLKIPDGVELVLTINGDPVTIEEEMPWSQG